jgi:transposase-like protein
MCVIFLVEPYRIMPLTSEGMKSSRKKYSAKFKIWAAKTCIEHKSVRLATTKLRINRNSLQHWKNLFREGKLSHYERSDPDSDRKETARLQKELKNITLERDILKESAGNPAPEQTLCIPVHKGKYGQIPRREDVRCFSGDSQLINIMLMTLL